MKNQKDVTSNYLPFIVTVKKDASQQLSLMFSTKPRTENYLHHLK